MKLKPLLIFCFLPLLSGCAGLKNITAKELQQDVYFYKQFELEKSLDQVESAIYEYSTTCHSLAKFMRNPADKSKAKMTLEQPGLSATSVLLLLDFDEKSFGKTQVKSYAYYSTWYSYVDMVVNAINSPSNCE